MGAHARHTNTQRQHSMGRTTRSKKANPVSQTDLIAKAREEALTHQAASQARGDTVGRAPRVPPHSFKVARGTQMLWLRVTLAKVPSKFLQIKAEADGILVTTDGWSKNFRLDVKYPDGLLVRSQESDAIFEGGILKVKLPILVDEEQEEAAQESDEEKLEEPAPVAQKKEKKQGKKRRNDQSVDDAQKKMLKIAEQVLEDEGSAFEKKKAEMAKQAEKIGKREELNKLNDKKKAARKAEVDHAVAEALHAEKPKKGAAKKGKATKKSR